MVTNFSMNPKHSHVQGKEEQLILLSIPIQEYRDSKLSKKYRSTTHILLVLQQIMMMIVSICLQTVSICLQD